MPRFTRLPRLGRWPRLVLAGLCLLLAAASATSARGASGRAERTVVVVVAARDLPAGHGVTSRDITKVRWPARLTPHGFISSPPSVLGRRLAGPVAAREPVGRARLLGGDLAAGLPAGTVAVPVTVASANASDLLRPGDRVEIVAAPRSTDGFADMPAGTADVAIVASRLLVLSVLPGREGIGTDLVVAADHATALRLIRVGVSQVLAALGDPP